MAGFNYISIDTKAENIEKVANMEIVTSLLSENNTHEELPTAKAVFDTTKKVDENVSKLEAKTDNGIESLSVWNTAKGGEKSLTVNDVSSLIHKCSLKLTSEDGNIYKLNNENFELYNPPITFNYEIKENGILVLNGYTESQAIDALFYLKGLTIGEQYTFSILDAQGGFSPPQNIFYLNEDGSVGEPLENIVINENYATFTPTKLANCVAVLRAGASAQEPLVNNVRYPQLVLSTAPVQKFLDFSAVKVYVNGQDEYTPNIDGTVTDIERYYPTMEITTNNQNVDISDFSYCVDTKKYINNHSTGIKTPEGGEIFNDYESNKALNLHSHAEGQDTKALGLSSHAEGSWTDAIGVWSHAEGYNTKANGKASHAAGYRSKAKADYSHASGEYSEATAQAQFVVGKYNKTNDDTLFIVGNGTSTTNRSNALEVYNDGHTEIQTMGETDNSIANKQYVDNSIGESASAITNIITDSKKSLTLTDVSPLPHKCSLQLTSDTYETTVGESNNIYNFAANNDGLSISVGGSYDTYTFTRNGNGTITINGYLDPSQPFSPSSIIYSSNLTLGKTYTLSLRDSNGEYIGIEQVWGYDVDLNNLDVSYKIINNGITFTHTDSSVNSYFIAWNRFNNSSAENPYVNYTLYPQLEMGSQVTDWTEYGGAVIVTKPYIEDFSTVTVNIGSESYTPSADGFVTDIVSASPTMEITTDNPHANIHNFSYCVDTKKYVDNNSGGSLTVDQTYNPNSENAQSGKAVNEAVEPKLDKPSMPPTVGNVLKVLSVNADGTFTCEWSDTPSGGAVDDVKINGASIIENGVANIPIATNILYGETPKLGVVGVQKSTYGIDITTDGLLQIKNPSNENINQRNSWSWRLYNALTMDKIDYAVKAAMCDGKGAEWTDTERIAALLRMGCTVDENGFVKWTAQEVAK